MTGGGPTPFLVLAYEFLIAFGNFGCTEVWLQWLSVATVKTDGLLWWSGPLSVGAARTSDTHVVCVGAARHQGGQDFRDASSSKVPQECKGVICWGTGSLPLVQRRNRWSVRP